MQRRKVFVGGLPHNLRLDTFKDYFGLYGYIEDAVILADKRTARPRGFGFVTYSHISSVEDVLDLYDQHMIEGKWVEVKSSLAVSQMKDHLIGEYSNEQPQ